jgi:heptosyltransferase II
MSNFKGKIIIVKLSALGDVLASTGLMVQIKKENPQCHLTHLVMSQCKVVTQNLKEIDEIIEIPLIPTGCPLRDAKNVIKLLFKLISGRFDLAIILHRSVLLQMLCKISGIKKIIGFKTKISGLLSQHVDFTMIGNRSIQELSLAKKAKLISNEPKNLKFVIDESKVNANIINVLPDRYIAVNPGGGNPHAPATNKQWPETMWINYIISSPLPIVMIGNGIEDQKLSKKIQEQIPSFINLVCKTNFHESALILKKATLYVGNDSAMLYLAAALGVRSIGLYGPTDSSAFEPLGANQISIQGISACSPCYSSLHGIKGKMYTCSNNICMQSISVEKVLQYTKKL